MKKIAIARWGDPADLDSAFAPATSGVAPSQTIRCLGMR